MTLEDQIDTLKIDDQTNNIDDPIFRKAKIAELRKLVKENENLDTRTDDDFLVQFLRARGYRVELAYNMLRNRTRFNERYTNSWQRIERLNVRKVLESGMMDMLPGLDSQGRKIFWLRTGLWNPREINNDLCLQIASLLTGAAVANSKTRVSGVVAIFDMKDLGFTQLKSVTPSFAKKMIYFLMSCLPMQLQEIHIIRESAIFGMIFAIFKKFMSEEIHKQIKFHGNNLDSLYPHISKSVLPAELGGNAPDEEPTRWLNVINTNSVSEELKRMDFTITN